MKADDGNNKDHKIESILNALNQPPPSGGFKSKLKLRVANANAAVSGGAPSTVSNKATNDGSAESKNSSNHEDESTQSLNLPLPLNPNYKLLDILEEFKLSDKEGIKPAVPPSASSSIPLSATLTGIEKSSRALVGMMKSKYLSTRFFHINIYLSYHDWLVDMSSYIAFIYKQIMTSALINTHHD